MFLAAGAVLAASHATAQTLPGAPGNLAAYAGDASATLTWDAPASDGGMSITKYQYRSATSDTSTDPPTLTWGAWTDFSGGDGNTRRGDVSGLTNGTAYTFEVRAVNGGGNGPASNQAAVTPTSTAVVNTWELSLSSDTIVEGGANVTATVRIASGPVFDADQSILLTWDDCHIGPNADILLPGVPCISGDVRGIGEGGYSKWIVILAGERAGSLLLTTFQRQQGLLDLYTAYPYDTYLVATLGTTEIGSQPLTYVDAAPKPEVTLQAVNMEVVEGERIQLRIRTPTPIGHVFSDILVSVTDDDSVLQNSFPNGQELDFANTRRRDFNPLSTDSTATTGAREVTFELQYADDDDHHFYTLGAAAPVTVTVLDKDTQANAPQDFKVQPDSGRIVLSWEKPAANGAAIEKYQYRESTDGGTSYGAWTDIPGGADARFHGVANRTNGTAYTYQVQAFNRAGGSTETEAMTATPMFATWSLTLTPTGGIGVAEAITEGGNAVTADLHINGVSTFTEDQTFEVSWAGAPVDADNLVRGVENKTTIVIRAGMLFGRLVLEAPDDPEGEGVYRPTAMETVTVTLGGDGVVAPRPLTLVDNEPKPVVTIAARSAFETEGLSLRFLATLTGRISEEVRVTAEVSNDPAGSLTTATSKNFRFSAGQVGDEYVIDTDENTTVDVLRKVTVTLTSNHADSEHYTLGEPSSVTVTVLDDDVAPGTPGNLTAEGGLNKVTLSWDGPTDGAAVSKYQYRVSDDGITFGAWTDVPGESSARSYAVRGLVTGNEYTFELHAVNAIGVSPRAGPVTKRVPSVPGPPGNLRAKSLDGAATLTWDAADDGGSRILRYEFRQSTDGGDSWGAWTEVPGSGPGTTEYTVPNLTNFTAHTFEVWAVNSDGNGEASNQATAYPGRMPTAPEELTTEESDRQVTLRWMTPVDDGGYPIVRYEYRYKADGDRRWRRDWTEVPGSGATTTEYTVTGLTNGTAYNFEVRAVTVVGAGEAARVTAIPQRLGPPGVPRSPTLSSGDGKVVLQWFPPRLTGLRPIERYEYRLDADGNPWVPILDSAPGGANHGRYEIARENGEYAIVYLRAVNDQGAGSDVHRGAMPFAGAPGPPGNFSAELISETEFRLSWTQPAAPPGATITGYIIDASPDGVTDWGQRTYDIEVPGPTSLTGRVGLQTGYFRIRTQFLMDTKVIVDGTSFETGMSETSPVVGLDPGEAVDPTLPQIRVEDAFAREGLDEFMLFTVTLHPASTFTAFVDYRTEDVTATAPADYERQYFTLTFAPGETEKIVSVRINDDSVEDSGEVFALLLSNPAGARLGDEGAAGVIYNDEDVLGGFTLVDAASGTDVGVIEHGATVALDDPANGSYGIVAGAAPDVEIGSVRLELSGAKTVARTDGAAPYTLYAEGGEALPAGGYTLSATAYPQANGVGDALETRTVSFTVTAADATDPAAGSSELSVGDAEASEGEDAALAFVVTLDPAADATVTVDYATADGTATAGDDYTATSGTLTFEAGETTKTVSVPIAADTEDDGGETLTLTLSNASGAGLGDGEATGTILDAGDAAALSASFSGVPAAHDGESTFNFRVEFSEDVGIGYETLRDESFSETNGDVTGARRVDGRHDLWEITVEPDSREAVTITLNGDRDCGTTGAVCTRGDDPRPLSNSPSATVAGPDEEPAATNTAATGAPNISGTAQVGETLTASVSDISDADGLDDASYEYQWIRGSGDIEGATDSSYTLVSADEGETIKVRVAFTDDAGNAESLTSEATDAVAPAPEPLTATFDDVPSEHAGQGETFTFGLNLSENVELSYLTLRDVALSATGGAVREARRQQQGSNQRWTIKVEPSGHGPVTVTLPETTDCGASGAICTADGRGLSHSLSATVAGPVGISVADARVEEDDGAVLSFAVTLSRAASGALTVDYATSDGSAQAGVDYTAASGTLTFQAGESSRTIEVSVLDDSHDDDGETLTLTLSNPSSGRLTDAEATGTIENRDPLPRALLARFGRTAAVHVVEHVEERIEAPREPGFRGRFAGRELRRGMERELALSFLSQFGGSAGANGYGVGGHDPMAGSPGAGFAGMGSLRTPGLARGGVGMPGAAGTVDAGARMRGAGTGAVGGAGMMSGAPGPMSAAAGPDGGLFGGGLHSMGLGGDNLLTGSAFAMNRESHGGILSFWSRGAQSHFAGREGTLGLSGDVRTTMFGADYAKGPLVAGLSLSHSRGLGEYAGVAAGQVASAVTGLYPWLGYKATDRVTVWGVAGYGRGGLLLTPDSGPALESGLSMAMAAAAGTRGELIAGGAGGFALAFKADALWVGTAIDGVDGAAGRLAATEAAVTRFRTGLEGSRAYTLAGRLSLRPSVEVGLRHDGGDAETGAGMDVGAGLIVSDAGSGLAVDVRVRTLLVHQAEGFRERGMALSLSYNPTPSTPLGLTAKVAPSWGGQATSGAEALWGQETMAGMAQAGVASGSRLDAEVGYGLPVGSRFVGTPRVGVGTSEMGRDYRLGYSLGVLNRESLAFELGVEAHRRESPMLDTADNGFLGLATVGW